MVGGVVKVTADAGMVGVGGEVVSRGTVVGEVVRTTVDTGSTILVDVGADDGGIVVDMSILVESGPACTQLRGFY